jgi:queuosine precursor transporter
MLVVIYLVAIVAANLLVATFGPSTTPYTAFLFIGLDLTCRDRLHESWQYKQLGTRMALLIVAGSVLSWLLNRNAGPIALASCVAFGAAATVDALAYHGLRWQPWAYKVNGSNILSAAVDSLLFPTLAFGTLLPAVVLGQFAAKVAGGLIWSVLLRRRQLGMTV